MTGSRGLALLLLAIAVPAPLAIASPAPLAAQSDTVTLYVPAFEGPASLGRNVATILNLQVWQTLRRAPYPNPRNLSFGSGLIIWDDGPLASATHDAAEHAAMRQNADLALWGSAVHYGDGVVVQPYMTIVDEARGPIWEVSANGVARIGVDLPRLRYEFRPIALTNAIVNTYTSPGALRIYAAVSSNDAIGVVGSRFTGLEHAPQAARIQSGGITGWIRLPALSSTRSEVVDFVGGVIRILRSDWDGAAALFDRVIDNPRTPTTLALDAHLYRGVALERAGRRGTADFERAYQLNPYDRAAATYLLMSRIAVLSRTPAADPARARLAADAQRFIATHRYLFPGGDAWLARATGILER